MKSSVAVAPILEDLRLLSSRKEADSFRPPLKWVGGKRWQVPYLFRLYRGHKDRRIVEPFSGGLAVTLGLMPKEGLLNDINPHLINFYRWLKRGLLVHFSMQNSEAHYYRRRSRFNDLLTAGEMNTEEAAGLFYYLNRTGYNGLCRFNRRGQFNVPFGRHPHIKYTADFRAYKSLFARWKLSRKDFEKLSLVPTDFVYADPPYDVEFTKYSKEDFAWSDQVRLAKWLASHRGPVVLSNQATPRITKLYKKHGFRLRYLEAPRRISCNGDRSPAREVLATKNI